MPASRSKFTVALVQMRCSAEREANLEKAIARLRRAASAGTGSPACRSCFCRLTSARARTHGSSTWPSRCRGRPRSAWPGSPARTKLVIIASVFERRAAGLYHNTAVVLDADGTLAGIYRKMHIPDDPLYYEKYYFTPGDLGFRAFDTRWAASARWSAGTSGIPRRPGSTACAGRRSFSIPPQSAGIPREKDEYGAAQQQAWEMIQRSHAIANGVYVAAVNRVGHEGPADGGLRILGRLVRERSVRQRHGPRVHDREELLLVECDPARRRKFAATGRSCATAGSTPMATSPVHGLIDESGAGFSVPVPGYRRERTGTEWGRETGLAETPISSFTGGGSGVSLETFSRR